MSDDIRSNLQPDTVARYRLLLVDDDPLIIESLGLVLQDQFELITADTRKQVDKIIRSLDCVPSLALVDLGLPPKPHKPDEGFVLIHDLLALNRDIKILILSGQDEQANIQHALTLGAVDFIPKPCDIPLLKTRLQHQVMMLGAEHAQQKAGKQQASLIGKSAAIDKLHILIKQFADTPFPVLIEGESGSGKELVAESLHNQSTRAHKPFLTLNCAAISPELLEAELFGHSKGAFTGATSQRTGFFEEAGDGSLFLDEIGELSIELQSKLLRVLENGEYYRLGESTPRKSSARIIAATNQELGESVKKGMFRQDLFHRLNVLTIYVPPLRERDTDCLLLLDYFREIYTINSKSFTLSDEARELLLAYTFPGNIRELRNIVIRLCAKYPGTEVSGEQIKAELESTTPYLTESSDEGLDVQVKKDLLGQKFNLDNALTDMEQRYIKTALELSGGNHSQAARLLGINRTTLYSRLGRHNDEDTE